MKDQKFGQGFQYVRGSDYRGLIIDLYIVSLSTGDLKISALQLYQTEKKNQKETERSNC